MRCGRVNWRKEEAGAAAEFYKTSDTVLHQHVAMTLKKEVD